MLVAVVGDWANRSALGAALRQGETGFLLAGKVIKRVDGTDELPITIADADPNLAQAFHAESYASGLTPADLAAIQTHTRTVWIGPVVSVPGATRALEYAGALVRAGGLGVRVASSGKVYAPSAWLRLSDMAGERTALYSAFVAIAHDGDGYVSCGMHNFGLADAIAPGDLTPERAGQLLNAFQLHVLADPGSVVDGGAFQESDQTQRFQLLYEAGARRFPEGDPRHNPWGLWRLR